MFSDNFCSNEHRVPRGERGESNILSLINRDTVVFRPRLAKRNRQMFPIAFKSDNFTRSNKEKSNIATAILEKLPSLKYFAF